MGHDVVDRFSAAVLGGGGGVCRVCGRPLSDPVSVRLGVGPVCRGKGSGQFSLFDDDEKRHIEAGDFSGDIILHRNPDGRPVVNVVQQEVCHSPTGFEWGYGGSGPADLALNILLRFTDYGAAFRLYQRFKWDFIAGMPHAGGVVSVEAVEGWLVSHIVDG